MNLNFKGKAITVIIVSLFLNIFIPELPRNFQHGTYVEKGYAYYIYYSQIIMHQMNFIQEYDHKLINEALSPLLLNKHQYSEPTFKEIQEINTKESNWKQLVKDNFSKMPIVIRNATIDQPEIFKNMNQWNLEYFEEYVMKNISIPVFTDYKKDKSVVKMPSEEFVKEFRNKENTIYARAVQDEKHVLEEGLNWKFMADLVGLTTPTQIINKLNGFVPYLYFIGSTHVNSRVHCDIGTSIFYQIEGHKEWTFFPPSESMLLFPYGHRYNVAYNSEVDIFNVDYEKNPFYNALDGHKVVLNPGDVLIFPSYWWHGVKNLDDTTIGIDFAIVDLIGSLGRNPLLTLTTVLNPNLVFESLSAIFKQKALTTLFFDGYYK